MAKEPVHKHPVDPPVDPTDGPVGPITDKPPKPFSGKTVTLRANPNGFGFIGGYFPEPKTLEDTAPTTKTDKDGRELGLAAAVAGDPVPYVFGRALVTPLIIATHVPGTDMYVDFLIGAGEIEEIEYLVHAGENIGKPSKYDYFTGTAGQSASGLLSGALGSYDTLANMAHFVVELKPEESLDFKVMVKGLKLFDPRTSPQAFAYSRNPALALARIFVDAGFTMNWDSVATAANYCDEDVSGESRWTVDLPVVNRKSLRSWVETFATYANCLVDMQGGEVILVPDKKVTSSPIITRTVTAADIVEGTATTEKVGIRQVPKQVIVQYTEENGQQRTAVAGSGSSGEVSRLQLPGIQTYTMARRMAVETLNKAQFDLRHKHVAFDTGVKDSIGDLHDITYAPHGLSDKRMRLISYTAKERGRWEREFVEYNATQYSDSVFIEPDSSDTTLPNANTPPDGPTPTAVEELYTDETGTTFSRLKITFTGVTWPYVDGYQVKCDGLQNVLNTLIAHEGAGETHTVYTAALKQGVSYTTTIKVKSATGALSATPGTLSGVIAQGKLLPPGDVTGFSAFEAGTLVAMSWSPAEEITGDLRGYIIKRIPSASFTGIAADWTSANTTTITGRVDATSYLTAAQPTGLHVYMIKAYDQAGNQSTNYAFQEVNVTSDTGSSNLQDVGYGTGTNVHFYRIDGDANYVVTANTSWTWGFYFPYSGSEVWSTSHGVSDRWGENLNVASDVTTEVWDTGTLRSGNWNWSTQNVTAYGGTQTNTTSLGDNSSPINYTNHSGTAVVASGQNFKAKIAFSSGAGNGFKLKLPIQASFSGASITQSGTVTVAATSPLDNPKSVTFTTAYSTAPAVTLTPKGSTFILPVLDNLTNTGMDIYLFDASGALVDGSADWSAIGT